MTTQYRLQWDMPSPMWAAGFEHIKDFTELWSNIPWRNHPIVKETEDIEQIKDQYKTLQEWEETKRQPIKNVKLFQREIVVTDWVPCTELDK